MKFFAGPHTFDNSGITIHTPHGVIILFAKLGTVIADEAALKSMWSCKGSAGHRPCLLCSNVVSKRSELESLSGAFVDISCVDFKKFRCHTKASILSAVDRIAAPGMGNPERKQLETRLGWVHNPYGVLLDPILRGVVDPVSTTMFDPAHTLMVHGVFHTEMTLWLDAVNAHMGQGFSIYSKLDTYIQDWVLPKTSATATSKNYSARVALQMWCSKLGLRRSCLCTLSSESLLKGLCRRTRSSCRIVPCCACSLSSMRMF